MYRGKKCLEALPAKIDETILTSVTPLLSMPISDLFPSFFFFQLCDAVYKKHDLHAHSGISYESDKPQYQADENFFSQAYY